MLLALLFVVYGVATATADTDTYEAVDTVHRLHEVDVRSGAAPGGVRRDMLGGMSMQSSDMMRGMRSLGESDAVAVLRMVPGYSGGSDYASGVSVNGAALSHTSYSVDGVTVFNPFHFGGIFSTFIPGHYSRYKISPYPAVGADMRIGGTVDALTSASRWSDTPAAEARGTLNAGILASSATIDVPAGPHTSVKVSGRTSYIDMLCSRLVDTDESTTRYRLTDGNITAVHRFDNDNVLKANGFASFDRVGFTDTSYGQNTTMRWSNALGAVTWLHNGSAMRMRHTAAYSASTNRLALTMPELAVSMPSDIRRWGVFGEGDRGDWSAGYRLEYTSMLPQAPQSAGTMTTESTRSRLGVWLYAAHASHRMRLGSGEVDAALRVSALTGGTRFYYGVDPGLTYSLGAGTGMVSFAASMATQYLQQVGFTDIGMSSNFRLPPTGSLRPLRAYGLTARYINTRISTWLGIDVDVYVKRIRHEADYRGNLLDVLAEGYDAIEHVSMADGYNTGGNVSVMCDLGALSGWVGYSLSVCRRHYASDPGRWLPSSTEPLHALKVYADYRIGQRLRVGTYFTLSTGRPYTPVRALYIIAGNVITEYGARNSARLPAYHRLDVWATYTLPPLRIGARSLANYLNFTLINAYGHHNTEMQYYTYDREHHAVVLHRVSSLYRFLPSLSYTVEL